MQQYIGTKLVRAVPMTRAAYNELREWSLPADENGADAGYLVEYLDGGKPNHKDYEGYISWSPAAQFDTAYMATAGLTYGLAIDAMRKGYRVARAGWNGMWVALGGTPVILEAEKFWNPHSRAHAIAMGGSAAVEPYFIMKTAQDSIQMGWVASQSDSLATDWVVLPN